MCVCLEINLTRTYHTHTHPKYFIDFGIQETKIIKYIYNGKLTNKITTSENT